MSRGLTSAMRTAVASGTVYPIFFGEFDFSGGIVYVHSGFGPVVWNSKTWLGMGKFVSVQPVNETSDVAANNVSFSLSGVPSSMISEVFNNRSRGRPCTLWFGCFSSSGTLLADPQVIFSGRMDQPVLNDQGSECTVNVTAESRLIDLQRPRERRFTDQDQRNYFPSDGFFKFVAGLQDRVINWGVPGNNASVDGNSTSVNGVGAGGGGDSFNPGGPSFSGSGLGNPSSGSSSGSGPSSGSTPYYY